jgi:hypothetical protein
MDSGERNGRASNLQTGGSGPADGVLLTTPVAVLGSSTLDVLDVEPSSLVFASAAVKTVGKTDRLLCSFEDVSGDFGLGPEGAPDGFTDLVCQFVTISIQPEDGGTVLTLQGELMDGTQITGSSDVIFVP